MHKQESSQQTVVLVDDESSILLSSKMLLASAGIRGVETVEDSRELMPLLARKEAAVVVLDLFMPYISGTQLLPEIVREYPDLPVIVMTATQEVETAVSCMKEGAFDYLVKPVEESRFVSSVKRALELRSLRQQVGALKRYLMSDHLEHGEAFASIITVSRKMRNLFQYAEAIAEKFFVIIEPPPVPTLSQWGIIVMAGLFAGLLTWTLKRKGVPIVRRNG